MFPKDSSISLKQLSVSLSSLKGSVSGKKKNKNRNQTTQTTQRSPLETVFGMRAENQDGVLMHHELSAGLLGALAFLSICETILLVGSQARPWKVRNIF